MNFSQLMISEHIKQEMKRLGIKYFSVNLVEKRFNEIPNSIVDGDWFKIIMTSPNVYELLIDLIQVKFARKHDLDLYRLCTTVDSVHIEYILDETLEPKIKKSLKQDFFLSKHKEYQIKSKR